MKRVFSGLLDALFRAQWMTVCLPELFLGTVSVFWFVSDLPKPDAIDIRREKIILFLSYLVCCIALKFWLYFKLYQGRGAGQLSWKYLSFFLAMIELGWFFDLYIVGWSAGTGTGEIIRYALDWYVPLLGMLLAGGAILLWRTRDRNPLVQRWRYKQKRRRRRAGQHSNTQKKTGRAGAVIAAELHRGSTLTALLILYTAAGMFIFWHFRAVSSYDLGALNLRSRFVEGIKAVLLVLLYLFHAGQRRDGEDGISGTFAAWLSFLACGLTAGMFLLAREAGSAIILVIFAILQILYFYSRRWGFVLAWMSLVCYGLGWIAEWMFRRDGYPEVLVNTIGMERWDRLYNLSAFPQVREMRTVLLQSVPLRGLIPYNVPMSGKPFTRVEDFSYLNLVTVFGRLAAIAVIGYYVLLLLRVFFRLDNAVRGRRGYQLPQQRRELFVLAQFMSLYIVTHALVHVISNLSFLFFTGVPLPFISKGLSNLALVMLCSVLIVICLQWEDGYARERKSAAG